MNSRIAAQSDFRSRGVIYRRATKADDAELRALLHDNDMDSWVNLCFEREPSFFDGESLMGESTAVIALDESKAEFTCRHVFVFFSSCSHQWTS